MDTELLGLPAEVGTALALIASGVIVPAVTSVMSYPGIPKKLKRALPIVLAAAAAGVIVLLQSGGPAAERVTTWLVAAATVVGIAQAVYAVMPGAWKALERTSSSVMGSRTPASDAERGQDGTSTLEAGPETVEESPAAQSGVESFEDAEPPGDGESGYPRG